MSASTTIDFGNRTITITAAGGRPWQKDTMARRYFDISVDGKANPLHSFYEIISGSTSDEVIEMNGKKFGFKYGFCDSKTKRKAAAAAAHDLASQIGSES